MPVSLINSFRSFGSGTPASPPTLVSSVVNGSSLVDTYSASVTIGAGGNGGKTLTMSGGASTATYSSGAGTTSISYSLSRAIAFGETGTSGYTQPGNGIEAVSGGADVATYSGAAVTNNTSSGVSTQFNSLYAGSWVPNSGTDAKTLPTETKPAKSTNILTGGYRDQRYDTEIRRTTNVADQTGATATKVRHEYSGRQVFNADSTKKIVSFDNGWWALYDASTNAVIPSGVTSGAGTNGIQGLAGDCEPIWHPTDPNKFWHTDQSGGLVWYERTLAGSGVAPTTTTLIDFTAKLAALGSPWTTVGRTWWMGEGRPSDDGRWWALHCETSGFTSVGLIMYDKQTDTITGSVLTGGHKPNWVGTSPLGNYIIASWYDTVKASLAAEAAAGVSSASGVWAFNRDGSFHRVLSVLGEHSNMAVDTGGNEVYCGISFHGNLGTPGVGWDELTSDGVFCRRIDTGAAYVITEIEPYIGGGGFHFSGCASSRPGWMLFGKYGAASGGSYGGTVGAFELKSTGRRVYRFAHSRWGVSTTIPYSPDYWSEPHASVNRDFTRITFASSWQGGNVEDYDILLPSWAMN